jgi:hypothetical protein
MFSSSCLTEKGVEGVITTSYSLVAWHLTIRLDTMLQTVQLPAGITNLDTGLTNVDRDTLTLELYNSTTYTFHVPCILWQLLLRL